MNSHLKAASNFFTKAACNWKTRLWHEQTGCRCSPGRSVPGHVGQSPRSPRGGRAALAQENFGCENNLLPQWGPEPEGPRALPRLLPPAEGGSRCVAGLGLPTLSCSPLCQSPPQSFLLFPPLFPWRELTAAPRGMSSTLTPSRTRQRLSRSSSQKQAHYLIRLSLPTRIFPLSLWILHTCIRSRTCSLPHTLPSGGTTLLPRRKGFSSPFLIRKVMFLGLPLPCL